MDTNLITCLIDSDKLHCQVAIKRPEGDEPFDISAALIIEYLKSKGINYGINPAAVEALTFAEYDKFVEVATGKASVPGVDGHFEFSIPMEDKKAKPVVAADGSVDYLNSLNIAMVNEGEIFAHYIEPTNGEYGFTIYSELLKPIPGKPTVPLRGVGFSVSDDGKEYTATKSGRIFLEDKKVVIEPLYTVNGDLDVTHGNIKFNGDVEVRGDVRSGMRIEAEGSIFISGHVGSCEIIAGENIVLGKGVQGKYNCRLTAGGDIAGNFCEHCHLTAGGKIYANSLLDCVSEAGNSVIVTTRMGRIIGGSTKAMQYVQARDIGNETEIVTKLYLGVFEDDLKRLEEDMERRSKVEADMELCESKLKSIDRVPMETRPHEMVELRTQIMQAKILRGKEKLELDTKISTAKANILNANANAAVKVEGAVYRGVRIITDSCVHSVEEAYSEVVFKSKDGKINMIPLDEYNEVKA